MVPTEICVQIQTQWLFNISIDFILHYYLCMYIIKSIVQGTAVAIYLKSDNQ
jgi:hypothetical protein